MANFLSQTGKPPKEEVIVTIVCKTTVHAKCVIVLDIEGGYRHFLTVNVKSEPSLFGVSVAEMDQKEDTIFPGSTYKVPALLVNLRHYLIDSNGLQTEGIFRNPGDEAETGSLPRFCRPASQPVIIFLAPSLRLILAAVKSKLNKGTFKETPDIHAISNLIKVSYPRNLVVPSPPYFLVF